MRKPNNFENVPAQGEFTPVELGGHKLIIKQVEERMSKTNKPMIVVSVSYTHLIIHLTPSTVPDL